ncbi:MAG TPA: 6-phosphogluconolactonase [Thermoanaerobaculia bacterium]|nr:6-phosphogluconolactonase [Thermoanaerobaculia bacterium]
MSRRQRTDLALAGQPCEVRILPGPADVAEDGAGVFVAAAKEAIGARGVFHVALSGGSTPRALHELLAREPLRRKVDWKRVRFFWGDERCVPPESERSNYRMARETLLEPLRIPAKHVFRMRGEEEPRAAAVSYEEVLAREFGARGPRLDLIFLGLGPDGHTLSLFPGTRALRERSRKVVANYVPKFREWRLTLTYPVVNAACRAVFLAEGVAKRDPAARILRRKPGYRELPASGIRPRDGQLLWLLDQEAGRDL